MTLTIEYFAILRDQAGRAHESLETEATTPAALYTALQTKYNFTLTPDHLRVAINDEFAPWDRPLQPNDRLVFIPPVAGG